MILPWLNVIKIILILRSGNRISYFLNCLINFNMESPSAFVSFLFGCIGSIAPEILRLYNCRLKRIHLPSSYFLVSVPFILLGGLMAIISGSDSLWNAFYVGLGTPFIINSAIKTLSKGKDEGQLMASSNFFTFINSL